MSINDKTKIKKINFNQINNNQKYKINFYKNNGLLGFGWTHNYKKKGAWSEGPLSFLMFSLKEKKLSKHKINLNFKPYMKNNNKDFELKIYFNDILKKEINLNKNKNDMNISFDTNVEEINNENIITFKFFNLTSPYDILESPDARKLGILLKSFEVKTL